MRGTRADGHLLSVRCAVDSLNLISQSIATLCAPFYNASRTRVCPAPRRLTDASPCQSHVTSGSGRRLGGSREVGEWGEVRGGGRAGVGGGVKKCEHHSVYLLRMGGLWAEDVAKGVEKEARVMPYVRLRGET